MMRQCIIVHIDMAGGSVDSGAGGRMSSRGSRDSVGLALLLWLGPVAVVGGL